MVSWVSVRKKALVHCSIGILWLALPPGVGAVDNGAYGSLVFTELMLDPEPCVGLPPVEYVEVLNRTRDTLDLRGWLFGYADKVYSCPSCKLPPGAYALLCGKEAATHLNITCPVLALSPFPALANTDRVIWLGTPQGQVVNALHYQQAWYGSGFKEEGGWSLECLDTDNLSGNGANWTASVDSTGGTPGRPNSVRRSNPDNTPPRVTRLALPDSITVELLFSKGLKPDLAGDPSRFQLWGGQAFVAEAVVLAPLFQRVSLKLSQPLKAGVSYELVLSGLISLSDVVMGDTCMAAGLPQKPDSFGLSVNELLFNPVGEGYDYVEVVNRSARCVDLSMVCVTSRTEDGRFKAAVRLATERIPAMPGSYWVLSSAGDALAEAWAADSLGRFLTLPSIPSLPDDKGNLVLLTTDGRVIDEVNYSATWHQELMSEKEGVALEKIHPDMPSNEADSWESASYLSGYGSPGLCNTQYRAVAVRKVEPITLEQPWLTPNGDGDSDALCLGLALDQPAQVSVTVYDLAGRPVRHWLRNRWLGPHDQCCWDGTDNQGRLLPQGRYVLLASLCRPDGWVHQAKWGISLWW